MKMRSKRCRNASLMGVVAGVLGLLGVWLLPLHPANGQERAAAPAGADAVPEGAGLAAKYPGDAGIERDPAVVFAENFETGSIADIGKRWGDLSNKDGRVMAFSDDMPPGSAGKRSLQMTATLGENNGGYLYTRLPRSVDTAFARFYVKFAPDVYPCFVHLGGYHPTPSWPQGNPGRPRGDDRVMVEIAPFSDYGRYPGGIWGLSSFWSEMKASADGNYWGNCLRPAQPAWVARDRWQCVEVLLQLNSAPGKSDGELALWLDGKLQMHIQPGVRRGPWSGMGFSLAEQGGEPFEGFRWRTSSELKVNFLWLLYNVTEAGTQMHKVALQRINRVWFDDIVISTAYVGPIQK